MLKVLHDYNFNWTMSDETISATSMRKIYDETEQIQNNLYGRKERRGASYVWNYCEKLSRHTIRCKLCKKIMSFHGTANVITHLQRRHNVLGDAPNQIHYTPKQQQQNINNAVNADKKIFTHDSYDAVPNSNNTSTPANSTVSVVWKYCTRVSQDHVRCCFCNKNLSYQGTSNLQRHLHRMHGILTHGRIKLPTPPPAPLPQLSSSSRPQRDLPLVKDQLNLIWQFVSSNDDGTNINCNMCEIVFNGKNIESVAKHLAVVHSVDLSEKSKDTNFNISKSTNQSNRSGISECSDDGINDDYNIAKWDGRLDKQFINITENDIIEDEFMYDSIIEEDQNPQQESYEQNDSHNYDEEKFDANLLHDDHLHDNSSSDNSPSSNSSNHKQKNFTNYLNQQNDLLSLLSSSSALVASLNTKSLLKLQEERLRVETEYFREKASYYRMQKYLTALQAKKVRMELGCFSRTETEAATVVSSTALNDPYTIDVDFNNHLGTQ